MAEKNTKTYKNKVLTTEQDHLNMICWLYSHINTRILILCLSVMLEKTYILRIIFVVSWLCRAGCPFRGDPSWAPSASCLAWEFPVSPWRHWKLWLTRRMPRIQSLAYCHPNLTLDKWNIMN